MIVRFEVVAGGMPQNGAVTYRKHEYSFDVEPTPLRGYTSILVNELSLEVDDEGNLISVWGMCPHTSWQGGVVQPPQGTHGAIRMRADVPLFEGVSLSITQDSRWPVVYDCESGWLCVGDPASARVFVEFVSGAILGIDDSDMLRSIWLRAGEGP